MITLSKIAKMANVSVSTASKAFSMSPEVNERTRLAVFSVAKELGCFKKFYNAKYPKLVIAIICPEFASAFYAEQISAIEAALAKYGCRVCVTCNNFSDNSLEELISYYYEYSRVDGIIIIGKNGSTPQNSEIPIVFTEQSSERFSDSLADAIKEALDYFKSKGISDIGFIGESLTQIKEKVLTSALTDAGIPINCDFFSFTSKRFEAGGYEAMNTLFERKSIPRAIFCAYDNLAIGAIRCILDRGLSVPNDVAIIGMDNIPEAEFLSPRLASIDYSSNRHCLLAAERIVAKIRGEGLPLAEALPAKFILRESAIIK